MVINFSGVDGSHNKPSQVAEATVYQFFQPKESNIEPTHAHPELNRIQETLG